MTLTDADLKTIRENLDHVLMCPDCYRNVTMILRDMETAS